MDEDGEAGVEAQAARQDGQDGHEEEGAVEVEGGQRGTCPFGASRVGPRLHGAKGPPNAQPSPPQLVASDQEAQDTQDEPRVTEQARPQQQTETREDDCEQHGEVEAEVDMGAAEQAAAVEGTECPRSPVPPGFRDAEVPDADDHAGQAEAGS